MTLRRVSLRGARRGFTLIELAIVVTIVGVLAVIAVVGYRKYILHSKVTEAQGVISAIRIAQEDYRSERGLYANIGDSKYCPDGSTKSDVKVAWNTQCSGGTAKWNLLPVHVGGPVQFGYKTIASTSANPAFAQPSDTGFVTWNSPTATPWYVVVAKCDLDGTATDYTTLVGSSFQNTIFANNEGL